VTQTADLRIEPGDGLLARHGTALLFLPAPINDAAIELVEIFVRAQKPSERIGEALVDRALRGPSLVLIEWDGDVALMVFGDLEASTDQPSLPMLSGASSASWVEHRLPISDRRVAITVSPPTESVTNLLEGVVPAGGFSLEIGVAATPPSVVLIDESSEEASSLVRPPLAPTVTQESILEPVPAVTQLDLPAVVDPGDSVAALEAIQAAAVGEPDVGENALLQHGLPPAGSEELHVPEVAAFEKTIPPTADASEIAGRRVPAKLCADGHANPEDAAVCWTCDSLMSPTAEIVNVPDPCVGQLHFDDESVVPVERALTLGRSRDQGGDTPHVHVDGDNVSRVHVAVTLRDWSVYVTDMGSTNGTILALQDGPVLLEPDSSSVRPSTSDRDRSSSKSLVRTSPILPVSSINGLREPLRLT